MVLNSEGKRQSKELPSASVEKHASDTQGRSPRIGAKFKDGTTIGRWDKRTENQERPWKHVELRQSEDALPPLKVKALRKEAAA